ncbi:Crp/Fnr family transcriptional regulator [Piscinibacter sp.]|uniref:Crp/Fnr family transcriptional regulator n=1 Tax=Piscinibacter sp. TaxID=1903157 RepID=UPI0037835433
MNTPDATALQQLGELYPALAALPAALRDEVLTQQTMWLEVPPGTTLFEEQSPCQGFPMVLSGEVRVARGSAQGRSLELYRVGPGELCVVSASCLFGQQLLSAHGETTASTRLAVMSPAALDACCAHEPFRRFIFGVFADRLADLMALAEAVAFQRLDQRLAATLLGHGEVLQTSHQALADELGTVREIVTRLLRRFERAGWLALGRERIELKDAAALRRLAAGDAAPG